MHVQYDLHIHTQHSHGQNSVEEMFNAGQRNGLTLMGFSEHSPRPVAYEYPHEYREHLEATFPDYVREVHRLAALHRGKVTVLLGMEVDWIAAERAFIERALQAYDFEYLLGSVHFLDHWGFDADAHDWDILSIQEKKHFYTRYFMAVRDMATTGLFNIAAHLDLIKIFSVNDFHRWIEQPDALEHITQALHAVRDAGMSMEISSAGLRKPCNEIYPCPQIMRLAFSLGVPISFGADGHCVHTIADRLETLKEYATSFGYRQSVWFCRKKQFTIEF